MVGDLGINLPAWNSTHKPLSPLQEQNKRCDKLNITSISTNSHAFAPEVRHLRWRCVRYCC